MILNWTPAVYASYTHLIEILINTVSSDKILFFLNCKCYF